MGSEKQQIPNRIELPPVRPDVTRVRLFSGRCGCCGERAVAPAPAGLEPGSPFGKSIEALVVASNETSERTDGGQDLLGMGVRHERLRAAPHPTQPRCCRGAGAVRCPAPARVGVRRPRQPARPCGPLAGLPGASCATRSTPSTAVMPASRRRSSACCCARLPLGDGVTGCTTPRWSSIAPTWIVGWTGCCPCHDAGRPPTGCAGASPGIASTCSCSSRTVPATNNVSERALRPRVIFRKVTNGTAARLGVVTIFGR